MTIQVTWEWLGQGPALDLANTVTLTDGCESDLLAGDGEYERWATAEAAALGWEAADLATLLKEGKRVLQARGSVRELVASLADQGPRPQRAIAQLNRISRAAPEWVELEPSTARLIRPARGGAAARLLAVYARDALRMAAEEAAPIRRCPAPSCGMFYPPRRPQQRWCSTQCGTRARVARHYRARRSPRPR